MAERVLHGAWSIRLICAGRSSCARVLCLHALERPGGNGSTVNGEGSSANVSTWASPAVRIAHIFNNRVPFSHTIFVNTSGGASFFSMVSVARATHRPDVPPRPSGHGQSLPNISLF